MKETNLKLQRQLFLLPAEERKSNNTVYCLLIKAGLSACLFLCPIVSGFGQEWTFDENTQKAYDLVLNLQIEEAQQLIPQPKTNHEHYVAALGEALELLITEDGEKFTLYEDRFEKRLDKKTKVTSADDLFLQAEIGLQWAFVHLKFGHEFDAALNLRQAYQTTQEIKKRFPEYTAIHKTSGLLDVIIGSVPEKYDWVLGLLNMEGSVEIGLHELESIRSSDHTLEFESDLLYALTLGFVLQQTDQAMTEIEKVRKEYPQNRLALFIGSALAIKGARSEEALSMLQTLAQQQSGIPLYYADYLKGEVYLHKADYQNAISSYRWFINHYQGQNYIKDANYKIGVCYWLNGNANDAEHVFKQAKTIGKEVTEADKYAARSMADDEMPHVKLTKVRYFMDGGYYADASKLLQSITSADLPTKRDQVEFEYRKARLAHKTGNLIAKELYQRTIRLSGEEPWYFAPNACLQLGYIYMDENDFIQAQFYFKRALEYKKHEYKNSIDSKAKSAIAQLNKRK
ncbi:MAG TPA: hypothetical protein VGK59_03375 [Ohtaekwangia sp.]